MKTNFKNILARLKSSDVDFIIIGGFAAATYGSSQVTYDLDICAVLSPENITKLRAALEDINPKHRLTTDKLSFFKIPTELEGLNNLYLETEEGVLDILTTVTGVGDFEELKKNAIEVKIFGATYKLISLDDLVKAKKAIARPKDLETVEELMHLKPAKE